VFGIPLATITSPPSSSISPASKTRPPSPPSLGGPGSRPFHLRLRTALSPLPPLRTLLLLRIGAFTETPCRYQPQETPDNHEGIHEGFRFCLMKVNNLVTEKCCPSSQPAMKWIEHEGYQQYSEKAHQINQDRILGLDSQLFRRMNLIGAEQVHFNHDEITLQEKNEWLGISSIVGFVVIQ